MLDGQKFALDTH